MTLTKPKPAVVYVKANDTRPSVADAKLKTLPPNNTWTGAIPVPKGLVPYSFQINLAVPWALNRDKSYLALDPGLGKTICAALYIAAMKCRAVYVCPPFMCANVELELKKWCVRPLIVTRLGRDDVELCGMGDVLIVPDSLLIRQKYLSTILAEFPKDGVLIVDEAHRFKSIDAKRTKILFNILASKFNRHIYLSGTPMPNRPLELYPVLKKAAPHTIGDRSYVDYGRYFCAGFEGQWGWDFSGASNIRELSTSIKKDFMLRVRKSEVLNELPPKTEQVVFIDDKLPKELAALEQTILKEFRPEQMSEVIGNEHLSTYRKNLGEAKAKAAAGFIRDVLDSSSESVLLFAIHRGAIRDLELALKEFGPLVITGAVEKDERFRRAQAFQRGDSRLLILNVQAGGVGFNLTKATRVVFAEFPWVPGEIDQASDRAHRIGQKDNVLCQFLVFKESLDALVLDTILNKRKITKHI